MTDAAGVSSESKRIIAGVEELRAAVGTRVGVSEWVELPTERFEAFRAATAGPGGLGVPDLDAPLLILSLGPKLMTEAVEVRGFRVGVNYGAERVRFLHQVTPGSRVRLGVQLLEASPIAGGVQLLFEWTFELESVGPCCVAQVIIRRYG